MNLSPQSSGLFITGKMMKEYIKILQEAYYNGKPLITDEQYDALMEFYSTDEEAIGPTGNTPHLNPMYSLRKIYPGRGEEIPDTSAYFKSTKIDGAAIELVYNRVSENFFVLEQMTTRGSVDSGEILEHRKHAGLRIPTSFDTDAIGLQVSDSITKLQITGEVGVTATGIENARNLASGKLGLDSVVEFLEAANTLGLVFFAYSILGNNQEIISDYYSIDLELLSELGFKTINDAKEYPELPTDGIVYRLDDNYDFFDWGFTAKAPRAAFAVKEDKDYVVTTLLDVEWNVGRTGKVVPTAIVEPVNIEGAIVSRATLNNPKFIEAMGLYQGCKVKLIRSGEIIPCIIGLYS